MPAGWERPAGFRFSTSRPVIWLHLEKGVDPRAIFHPEKGVATALGRSAASRLRAEAYRAARRGCGPAWSWLQETT